MDLSQPVRLTPQEWVGVLFFPVEIVVGMIVAWRWEGVGAGIAVVSGDFPRGPSFLLFTDRLDVHFVDASGPQDHVYEKVGECVSAQLDI